MIEPSQANSQGSSQEGLSGSSSASGDASLSTQQTQTAASGAAVTDPTHSNTTLPTRPDGLGDQYWDATSGVKMKELLADLGKLQTFKTEADTRAAAVPESAEKYTVALPSDFKMPEGWQVNADDPAWKAGREFAHANGLSQPQFEKLAGIYVEQQIAAHQRNEETINAQLKARDEALGANGAARVDALNNWFKGSFDEKVANQLSKTLWTPDIVGAFEKIQLALTNQGSTGFRQDGRTQGRTDGKPDGWDSWSAMDRRTWQLQQDADAQKRPGR